MQFLQRCSLRWQYLNIGAMRTIDLADYARDGVPVTDNLSIGFEYGDGAKIPDFECSAVVKSSSVHFHNVKSRSMRAGKRDLHTYTGTAEYSIEKIDENAMQLLRIGLLIGTGPKPSFGLGFLRVIDSKTEVKKR